MDSVDREVAQLAAEPPKHNAVAKLNYSHDAMIDLIISKPGISQGQLAAAFGYTQSWVCQVMASDAFQSKMAVRREEIVDPVIKASVEERMKALVIRALQVLQERLDSPQVESRVALRAFELGAKGLDIGGFGRPQVAPSAPPPPNRLEELATRLVELQANVRKGNTYENAEVVPDGQF